MTWILDVRPIVWPFLLENPAPVPGGDDSAGRKAAIESGSRRLAGAADVPGDVVDADAAAARRPVRRRREVGERREGLLVRGDRRMDESVLIFSMIA